jgi:hypothetical protein
VEVGRVDEVAADLGDAVRPADALPDLHAKPAANLTASMILA